MHTALHLAPVLAAEKSKVPYYVAGGLLVLWALVLALALGLRRPNFPGSLGGQRAVSAVTIVLVLATLTTAVVTSGGSTKTASANPARPAGATGETAAEQAPATTSAQPATTSAAQAGAGPASAPAAGGASKLKIAADPTGLLRFDTGSLSTKAGTVTITMTNDAQVEHNITIAQGAKVLGATPTFTGGTRTITLKLPRGRYVFYCSVPGHRQSGMEGTLTVS